MKQFYFLVIVFSIITITSAGQVSINTDGSTANSAAILDVKSTEKGFLPPRMTTVQMNLISSPPDGLIVYNITVKALYWYNNSAWKRLAETNIHTIGETYGGGVVFYVYDDGRHGLIAATSDQSTGMQWYNGAVKNTGSTGDGLGAGAMNTAMIVAMQLGDDQNGNFAAKVCADYSVTVNGIAYGDWYLPSKYELNLLFLQRVAVGGFAASDYWSATELNSYNAWTQYFYDGFQSDYGKDGTGYVRAIRAF